jgi:hypothetical protein
MDAQIFAALIGGLIAFSRANQSFVPTDVLSMVIPSLVFLFFMLQAINLHVVGFEVNRRAVIERKVNSVLADQLMAGESQVARNHLWSSSSPSLIASLSIYALLVVVFIIFACEGARAHDWLLSALHIGEFLSMLVVGMLWFKSQRRQAMMSGSPKIRGAGSPTKRSSASSWSARRGPRSA